MVVEFYKREDGILTIAKLETTRYKFKWEWFELTWPQGDEEDLPPVSGELVWGKSKPCRPGYLYCKACQKEISYGNRGKVSLTGHVTTPSHKSNMQKLLMDNQLTRLLPDKEEAGGDDSVSGIGTHTLTPGRVDWELL